MIRREDIPIGSDNAITRQELAERTGLDDRSVRHQITRLRLQDSDDPYVILSSSHRPAGYWRSQDPAEIDRYMMEVQARSRNTMAVLHDVRRVRGEKHG